MSDEALTYFSIYTFPTPSTHYTLHRTLLFTLYTTLYTVYFTLYTVHCTLFTVNCTIFSACTATCNTVHRTPCTLWNCTVHCTLKRRRLQCNGGRMLRQGQTLEITGRKIAHLGNYHLGKYPWEVGTWENTLGKLALGKIPLGSWHLGKIQWKVPNIIQSYTSITSDKNCALCTNQKLDGCISLYSWKHLLSIYKSGCILSFRWLMNRVAIIKPSYNSFRIQNLELSKNLQPSPSPSF